MNTDNGRLFYATGIDNSQLRADAAESRSILHSIGQSAQEESNRIDTSFSKIAKVAGSIFAISQVSAFAKQIITVRGEIESLQISFETLAGKAKGDALFGEIRKFAVSTPMMMKDLAQGAQTMLAFNIEAEKVMPILRAIGDISMGNAQKFNSLSLAFSQMSATGKLMGQDLMQMINAGFNPLSVISEETGKSIGELKEEMEKGKISAEMVTEAFMSATSEGGKFHGMLEKQSQGIAGSISNLQGAIDDMMNEIGTKSEGAIVSVINALTSLVKNYEQVGRILIGLIATYGTYKAAMIAVTAAQGWATVAEALHYKWLLLVEKAQRMLNATMLANPYVLVATLIAGVAAAMFSMKTEAERLREAEERYEEQKQKVIEAEQKHKEEIEKLCSVAEDEAVSTDARRVALHKLEQKYPDIFAKYRTETEMLENLKRIKQEIVELDDKKSITNPQNELDSVEKRIQELEALSKRKVRKHRYVADEHYPGRTNIEYYYESRYLTPDETAEYKNLLNKRDSLKTQVKKNDANAYFSNLTGISDDELKRQIQVRKDLLALMETNGSSNGTIMGDIPHAGTYSKEQLQAQLQQLQRQQTYRDADVKSGEQWVAGKKEAYEDSLKAYNDYVNGITSKEVKDEDFKKKSEELKGIMETAKKAYDSVKPVTDNENSKATRDAQRKRDNDKRIANETDARKQKIEKYADAVIKAQKEAEFEIEQNEINLLEDGAEKELRQIDINYRRLINENNKRRDKMVDALRDKKNLEWENANPSAKENGQTFDRSTITEADLSTEQKKQLEEYARIAREIRTKGESDALRQMLSDVQTYEQQRLKITEEYIKKRNDLYETETYVDTDGKTKSRIKTDADGNKVLRKGVTQGNIDELNRKEDEALKAVDEQFAQREDTYQAWCEEIADLSLENLKDILDKAEKELKKLEDSGSADLKALAQARAKVATAQTAVNKANAKNQVNPGKRTIKEWEDLYKTLNDVKGTFEEMGDTIGGTIGEIVSECGQFASSTLTMINGIVQLVNMSSTSMQATAVAGASAISTMEKASVILTIISAALHIAMQIASLFNDDEEKQKEIDKLQNRIDQLQWELDHQEIGRVQQQYGAAIDRLNQALWQTKLELAAGQQGWQRMITLMSRASHNQELMQKTAEKLAKAYGAMSYTADKALGEDKYKSAYTQLENIAQQQILLQEQINAEASKKDSDSGAIQDWKNKIEELGQQALELINEMVEDIIGNTSTGIAEELANAFFEAFEAGEDAAEAWGKKVDEIVADVLKRMLVSKFLEEPLGEIFDKYKSKWFANGQFRGLDSVIDSMQGFANDLNAVGADFAVIWENLPDSIKNMVTITSEAEREASQKGIAAADQDSIDELNGRMTAIQSHTFSINETTKLLLSTTQSILMSVMNIESETDGFGARLERMEGNVKEMANTLDDIATKGIRLKN